MRFAVVGLGAVGTRVARQLVSSEMVVDVTLLDHDSARGARLADTLGPRAVPADSLEALDDSIDVVVLAAPAGEHVGPARLALARGWNVVSTSDNFEDVAGLLALHDVAVHADRLLVVGAAFSPGLSCVLARHASSWFDELTEVHVAKHGTGGPACARQHHFALAGDARDWRDGAWLDRPGGSGRELLWFPDPVGPQDCYRAALSDALLLVPALPGVQRVTARVAATRRDRLTSHLPMMRRPHPEGRRGGIRVELRGRRGGEHTVEVLASVERPAVAAAAVAATTALWTGAGWTRDIGARSLHSLVDPLEFLHELARRGLHASRFVGAEPVAGTP